MQEEEEFSEDLGRCDPFCLHASVSTILPMDMPTGGSFVGPSCIRKRKCAVDGDTNYTRV